MDMNNTDHSSNSQGGIANTGAATGAPVGEGGNAAPQYLTRSDFDRSFSDLRRELSGHLRGLSSIRDEGRAAPEKANEPTEPDISKYNLKADNPDAFKEYSKLQRDWYLWNRHLEKQEEAKVTEKKSSEELIHKLDNEHASRLQEYRKEHPEFSADLQKVPDFTIEEEAVEYAIKRHPKSAEVVHYLLKNPGEAFELDLMYRQKGLHEVMYRIGEIASKLKADETFANSNRKAAGQRPPRQSNLAGSGSSGVRTGLFAPRREDYKKIFEDFKQGR